MLTSPNGNAHATVVNSAVLLANLELVKGATPALHTARTRPIADLAAGKPKLGNSFGGGWGGGGG